jgi:ketosteroid isomerase-like protein
MLLIKDAFRALADGGLQAGVDALLSCAHEDCLFRPFTAGERTLHGRSEVHAFFRDVLSTGQEMSVRPTSFEEAGDEIRVSGSMRLLRPTGGFAESQVRWTYRFRDGLVEEAHWGPRHEV